MFELDGDLESKLLHLHVVLMAIAAWFILWALRKMWKGFDENKWVRLLKPLYPMLLCEAFVWIPGVLPDATHGERVLMAIWAGLLSAVGYQLIRRFAQRVNIELPDDPNELASTTTPEDEDDPEPETDPGKPAA